LEVVVVQFQGEIVPMEWSNSQWPRTQLTNSGDTGYAPPRKRRLITTSSMLGHTSGPFDNEMVMCQHVLSRKHGVTAYCSDGRHVTSCSIVLDAGC
jgi:hypothetical protein